MDSIREALTAAVSKAETSKPDDDVVGSTVAVGTDEPSDADPLGTEDSNAVADDAVAEASSDTVEATATIPAPAEPEVPAPASWTAAERAEWKSLSPAAKKVVVRRESEMQRAFQTSATAKRRLEAIDGVTAQYKPLMDSYGVTLEQVLAPLLATRAALEVGTDEQKAQLVANLCADFGISIELLDSALGSRYEGGKPQRVQPPQKIDYRNIPELQGLFQLADSVKSRKAEQAAAAVQAVESLPNYEAVRFTMADLIEKARDVGQQLPLDKAHTLACQIHGLEVAASAPTVSASQAASILAKSRNAASSVAGAPKPTPPRKPGEGSVTDELTALMSGRR